MYRLICQKPAHFLSAQMALVSTFFQMFIVLGMYNFAKGHKKARFQWDKQEEGDYIGRVFASLACLVWSGP